MPVIEQSARYSDSECMMARTECVLTTARVWVAHHLRVNAADEAAHQMYITTRQYGRTRQHARSWQHECSLMREMQGFRKRMWQEVVSMGDTMIQHRVRKQNQQQHLCSTSRRRRRTSVKWSKSTPDDDLCTAWDAPTRPPMGLRSMLQRCLTRTLRPRR